MVRALGTKIKVEERIMVESNREAKTREKCRHTTWILLKKEKGEKWGNKILYAIIDCKTIKKRLESQQTLSEAEAVVILWVAYPFHPHSNKT